MAVFVDRNCSNLYLGGNNNLALVDSIRDALAEIDSVCLAFIAYKKLIKASKPVPDLGVKEVFNSFKEDNNNKKS